MTVFQNYIAGQWVAGASVTVNRNPSNVADVVGEYAQADAMQTRAAIAAAKAAFPAWASEQGLYPKPQQAFPPGARGRAFASRRPPRIRPIRGSRVRIPVVAVPS